MFRVLNIKRAQLIVFAVSVFAIVFSVFGQFILHKQPCFLCLISRAFCGVIAFVSFLSIKFSGQFMRKALFCIVALALSFSFYHLGVENHWWAAPKSCVHQLPTAKELLDMKNLMEEAAPSCDQVNWEIFSISSTLLSFSMFAGLFWVLSIGHAISYTKRRAENEND